MEPRVWSIESTKCGQFPQLCRNLRDLPGCTFTVLPLRGLEIEKQRPNCTLRSSCLLEEAHADT